jgi:hypothetical protein
MENSFHSFRFRVEKIYAFVYSIIPTVNYVLSIFFYPKLINSSVSILFMTKWNASLCLPVAPTVCLTCLTLSSMYLLCIAFGFSFFFFFNRFYIYSHVYTLFGSPSSPHLLFHPLVLWFCWRENIRDNKKDIVFLLVGDKDSYTERVLVLLPCTCVLKPTLVCLCQISSLLFGPLPIVASASLRLLYSLLYSEHINHIQILGFLPFPYSSCACSPLSVWLMTNNITAFILGLWSTYEEEHAIFGTLSLANFA